MFNFFFILSKLGSYILFLMVKDIKKILYNGKLNIESRNFEETKIKVSESK